MIRFECKKCGCLVLANKGSKTATCDICGKKQPVPVDVIDLGAPVTSHSYDPQWQHYEQLLRKARRYRDIKILTETAEEFDRLGEYEDSRAMADFCRAKAAEEEKKRKAEAEMRKKHEDYNAKSRRSYHIRMALLNTAVVAIAIVGTLISNRIIKEPKYEQGLNWMAQGMYEDAIYNFRKLGNYKDSEALLIECENSILEEQYLYTVEQMNNGHYAYAKEMFRTLSGYKDSDSLAIECQYRNGLHYLSVGNYQSALIEFKLVRDHIDCEAEIQECENGIQENKYQTAIAQMEEGKYSIAKSQFDRLNGYKDSDALAIECLYQHALQLMADGDYETAVEKLETIANHQDAAELIATAKARLSGDQ